MNTPRLCLSGHPPRAPWGRDPVIDVTNYKPRRYSPSIPAGWNSSQQRREAISYLTHAAQNK